MNLPAPRAGLVIRYSYLWARERDLGRDEGVKDRPCAVLLATHNDEGDLRVIVLPITHTPPRDPDGVLEIPRLTKRRLGLDDDQSWIVLTEGNAFAWPGPDLRTVAGGGIETVALGFLPATLIATMRDRFLALHKKARIRLVSRMD